MKIDSFSITYEIITPESAEHGESDETGYHVESEQGYSLSDALNWLRLHKGCGAPNEADGSPLSIRHPPRWFIFDCGEDFRTGARESLSLHIPESVTAASRMRIARILGYGRFFR